IIAVILLLIILFQKMVKSFENPKTSPEQTPSDLDIPFEEIRFGTANNRQCYGWLLRDKKTSPTVILVHGWGRNVGRMLPYIKNLYGKGYNLLAFDSRNHGNSDDDDHSTMKKFAEDISAAIDFIEKQSGIRNKNIGVIGLSIGGAATLYAAGHDDRINCGITVGAFANPLNMMRHQLSSHYVPFYPLGWLLIKYLQKRVGFRFEEIAPERFIGKTKAAILLIHGKDDKTVPFSNAEQLLAAGNKNVTLWGIPGRGHSDCHLEKGFWKKVDGYLNNVLK
ncbi:MAG: alpha/beta fold hydrolase, partial [Chlorobi bacterium]|nr:alpha/beta fold hydrolase [Chlorobiota bacterium]